MPRVKSYTGGTINFKEIESHLVGSSATARKDAVEALIAYFDGSRTQSQTTFDDKAYHRLFEALFRCTLIEKEAYFNSKKSVKVTAAAAARLERCPEALRLAVRHGVTTIRRKTARAIIDHIVQVLPGPDGAYVMPLLAGYVKVLYEFLDNPASAENIAALSGEGWEVCVDFCIDVLSRFLELGDRESGSLSRASPAPGATARSGSVAGTQGSGEQIGTHVAVDVLSCLYMLCIAHNAPIQRKADRLPHVVIQLLQLRQMKIGELQKMAFATFNIVFQRMQAEDVALCKTLVKQVVPLLSHWWQPRALSRDAMLNSIRDEMLKTLYGTRLYIQALLREAADESFPQDVEELLDTLWCDYSRREERARLQLDDITFTNMLLPPDHPRTGIFSLRPHHTAGEQNWALLENLAILEAAYSKHGQQEQSQQNQQQPEIDQPRKRRKMSGRQNRVHQKLHSLDPAVRLSALQLIPFLTRHKKPSLEDVAETLEDLSKHVTAKQAIVASWAMLACSSLAIHEVSRHPSLSSSWKQLWQLAVRSLSLPPISRASCVLLNSILKANLIPRHELADDINQIVTTADISGPAILVDASLGLMLNLLRFRNNMFPNASQATSNHIIRWVFVRWSPAELTYASLHGTHATPYDLVNLLRACYGISPLVMAQPLRLFNGPIVLHWKEQAEMEPFIRYLLLLHEEEPDTTVTPAQQEEQLPESNSATDVAGSNASRRLALELFYPKVEELQELAESWQKRGGEGATPVSMERLRSMVLACLTGALLLPDLVNINSSLSRDLESAVFSIVDATLKVILNSPPSENLFGMILASSAPYIPHLIEPELIALKRERPHLLKFFGKLSEALYERSRRESSHRDDQVIDIDPDFEPQTSQKNTASKAKTLPRRDILLSYTPEAFYLETSLRIHFLDIIRLNDGEIGRIPEPIINQLAGLSGEQFLCCREFMREIFTSDAIVPLGGATTILETAGHIVSRYEYACCEVALCNCIDIMDSFINLWTDNHFDIAEMAGDLYHYLVKQSLPNNSMSAAAQIRLASLLLHLLEVKSEYASNLGLPSSQSTLLKILQDGPMKLKHYIGLEIPKLFGLYVLKTHDDIFVDVLEHLPSDPDVVEGLAFRLFVLAELACRWPTLLRRSIYHTFEIPGKITKISKSQSCVTHSALYAASCIKRIAQTLKLSGPQELFKLFAPQLLYTWLDNDSIQDIAYEIFGFSSLLDLLREAQTEAAAIMMMRGQEQEVCQLAQSLGLTPEKLVQQSFTKIIAYSIAHDISIAGGPDYVTGESRMRKILGKEEYLANIHLNFADIISTFFDIFDQEDPIEKAFRRDERFAYAAETLEEIKKLGHLPTALPPNQQPMFRAKYLPREIVHLCSRTQYEPENIWTPALVVFVARKLLKTIHPALGPLHACSVLRKIRVLICLAGDHAISGYPLEMLLHSLRVFVVDPECADDALGITQYLIKRGDEYLKRTPSFLAGYALSSLADLRVFLESSQSSTTQESQFKATKSKAQEFHAWFSKYLAAYDSPEFKDEGQKQAFRSITENAAHIRASGNAEKGTHESNLLLEILKDWGRENQLLNEPARDVALSMLCGVFNIPPSSRLDVIETDEDAIKNGAVVWKSCSSQRLGGEYLAWAGRVLGRSFAASGEVPEDLLRESQLQEYRRLSQGVGSSEEGLLNLIKSLTISGDCFTAGLAEAALRTIVSDAISDNDHDLLSACQESLPEPLLIASNWDPYRTPLSDQFKVDPPANTEVFSARALENPNWSQHLAIRLALSAPKIVTLRVLPPILSKVKGFAERAFPFVVHLVLAYQLDKQQSAKRELSESLQEWLNFTSEPAKENLKLLINTILYLRTQPLPGESSIADRAHWLDVNMASAAAAATRCGMYKVALLFAELAAESTRGSRRSSAARETDDSSDILLEIFENIDDPDAYYGLSQDASLSTVLARLEYENDGAKSLAFRGAQYDSHLRGRDLQSRQDCNALIKALSSLGLAGLSNSLLQSQQSIDGSSDSLDATFTTARKLEIWNLPAPVNSDSWAVTVYKAYQSMYQAQELDTVRSMVHDGLKNTVRHLSSGSLNTSVLRQQLGALAALTELDDILNVRDQSELQCTLATFEKRSKWMMSGRYADVSQILSCRETTLSMWSQRHNLRAAGLTSADARLVQIRGMLLSSDIFRFHRARQETLNLSTALSDLIPSCESLGLSVDAAIKMEAANALWDHGEMISSIRMLQAIDKDSSLKKQSVPLSRSDLLSKIGYQVSVARLESPDAIQKKYLEPALKELKGKIEGREAGQVFHQFAVFCDEQLQNPDSLEDLARLQNLKKGKDEEVAQLKALIASAKDSQLRNRYQSHLAKAKQWQELDQQELRRVEQTRSEFLKLCIENYLLSLAASDEHDNDALRFMALWLEKSEEEVANEVVKKWINKVPTRKFALLMNQLSSRLQDHNTLFQKLLIDLVYRICVDHPYHGMYHIWTGARTRVNKDDEVAVSRQRATDKIAKALSKNNKVSSIWPAIDQTSRVYHALAMDRDPTRYKSGQKVPIKNSPVGQNFLSTMSNNPIPPPTLQIEVSANLDYSHVPMIHKFAPEMAIASGVSAPKILTAIGTDGRKYKQLVKGGNDDLRQDAIMEQVFAAVSELLKLHRETRQRNLGIRTYKVLPLTSSSGLIEFVSNTIPLHEYLMPAHERYYPKDLKGSQCRKEIANAQTKNTETRIAVYRRVTERFHPVMRYFFMEYFPDPDEWFQKRTNYTRTTAAISMLGHVLGLGDRHGHNILLDHKTGEVVHIDLGVAFEMGRVLPVPELVPFRLTRDIVDGMGITKTEGVFRRCCEFTLDALREEAASIQTILDSLRHDTLYQWSISPVRMAKLQNAREVGGEDGGVGGGEDGEGGGVPKEKKQRPANEPSEADRAIEVVKKKLSKTLSVMATVNDLINQATSVSNLAVLYSGWAAYA
uniref:Serine/threonine-protein kinase Tel1 n=1 Tax=Thermochaetoides thermophila TaxID=209285 RepID=A0A5Q0QNQ9_9PEZI|nr:Chain A, Serine/threonine-protein kinase Tel1 [Thermochaetoides thermophila DSM 1495]6SKY_B Chain B, Serine/threonine-protein kinase Tel1 [Thermochaetoides thermophila DSM 1495]6SKZ_A Chain A, Serine/threonine-protein kinase Tel1 [Thermochaetoides thermophila DSM 1495]6SL0_A Chain A, Serine/threonine-protein kinase Tel1 [Thermochaetoides thermophila DSM 1495]6SL0_B Chain B, Serine/threonine-protein kinase Tel1 [Thermochaetoides thermophila DSM 1495]QGA31134.1 Tel1 [Thermochaetoides thermoph